MRLSVLTGLGVVLMGVPAVAQVRQSATTTSGTGTQDDEQPVAQQQQQQTPLQTNQPGRTAQSSAGQVGQRQTRDTAAEQASIKPMARIASRIQNRVQNRLRTRIDRNYDPQAGATDPFVVAEDQARTTGRPR
ncbi:hypothetical protein ACFSC3_16955 [Sphingomonas floccifaciens]|uniref:Uncharacterized protein n=1 Tax=Sphingomonas floccifaciens TaxID=1844115 RepID=A0ABW4NGS8_9SPHN